MNDICHHCCDREEHGGLFKILSTVKTTTCSITGRKQLIRRLFFFFHSLYRSMLWLSLAACLNHEI